MKMQTQIAATPLSGSRAGRALLLASPSPAAMGHLSPVLVRKAEVVLRLRGRRAHLELARRAREIAHGGVGEPEVGARPATGRIEADRPLQQIDRFLVLAPDQQRKAEV